MNFTSQMMAWYQDIIGLIPLSTMRTAGHKLVEIGSVAYLYLNFDVRSMSVRKKFHVSVIVSKNNG